MSQLQHHQRDRNGPDHQATLYHNACSLYVMQSSSLLSIVHLFHGKHSDIRNAQETYPPPRCQDRDWFKAPQTADG